MYLCMYVFILVCMYHVYACACACVCVSGDILQNFIRKASVHGNKHNFMEPYAHRQDCSCLFCQALHQLK